METPLLVVHDNRGQGGVRWTKSTMNKSLVYASLLFTCK